MKVNPLIAKFDNLDNKLQQLLLVLSLSADPINQTTLKSMLGQFDVKHAPLYVLVKRETLNSLAALGLVLYEDNKMECNPAVINLIMRRGLQQSWYVTAATAIVDREKTQAAGTIARHLRYQNTSTNNRYNIPDTYIHCLRLTANLNLVDAFHEFFTVINTVLPNDLPPIIHWIFFHGFDTEWFNRLDIQIRGTCLGALLKDQWINFKAHELLPPLFAHYLVNAKPYEQLPLALRQDIGEYHIFKGAYVAAEPCLQADTSSRSLYLLGTSSFLQGNNESALHFYQAAIAALKKESGKKTVALPSLHGFFYKLALLRNFNPETNLLLLNQITNAPKLETIDTFTKLHPLLTHVLAIYRGTARIDQTLSFTDFMSRSEGNYFNVLFYALILSSLDNAALFIKNKTLVDLLEKYCILAESFGHAWYAAAGLGFLQANGHTFSNTDCSTLWQRHAQHPFLFALHLLPTLHVWEAPLNALYNLDNPSENANTQPSTSRLAWLINLDNHWTIEPKEQLLGKNGRWSKGRPVALKRLYYDKAELPFLSKHDLQLCRYIMKEEWVDRGYRQESFHINLGWMAAAKDHPYVFWDDGATNDVRVAIQVAEPQFVVKETKSGIHLSLYPLISSQQQIAIQKTATNGVLVYQINNNHRQIAEILGEKGLIIPKDQRQRVLDTLSRLASLVTVQSDIGGSASNAEEMPVNPCLTMQIQPFKEGLLFELFAKPFIDGGPLFPPGVGGATVLAEIAGKKLQTTRLLSHEKSLLQQVQLQCPELGESSEMKWPLEEPEEALSVLQQLQGMTETVTLEWPKGKKLQIRPEAGLNQMRFAISQKNNWFEVDASLDLGNSNVLDMQRLMQLLENNNNRFLQLGDGEILALTKELRRRLDDLAGMADKSGQGMRFHPLAAPVLQEISAGMKLKSGKHWKEQLRQLEESSGLEVHLPSTFQGELRDYQQDGYAWMLRLAHWGAGACLADDMGLGKTVQALAVILARAPQGPCLILAPTSVCFNWREEAQRFAPTLNVRSFGSGSRQEMLDQVGPYDVIVCTYGLLQTETERLTQVHWHTVVADEAQAIKNILTKRTKAALELKADFRIITTGTPVENHLGELWTLFNFLNPGLLGTLTSFQQKFVEPIVGKQDVAVQARLRKLLRPFILRRMKTEVLTELPSRTEVTLHVDLNDQERVLYESIRLNALEHLQQTSEQPGQQLIKVLADIMKLRQACCHPRLTLEDSDIPSSKMNAFAQLLEELLENRHKALVFSQFVRHLSLIRELLDKKGIRYHYLDGSTPAAQRQKAVNAFQAGDGDVFLISLKAGGSGLNLTAADYVIHMDPWWNPAVEDQASDRAHRMGQLRPVTIYRLVAKDTIEEKIVALHKQKRDLATSILEGSEVSGKLSLKDMMALLTEASTET